MERAYREAGRVRQFLESATSCQGSLSDRAPPTESASRSGPRRSASAPGSMGSARAVFGLRLPPSLPACSRQQRPAERQKFTAPPIRQESEVTNARESLGQNVFEKAAQELRMSQRHRAPLIVVRIVLPAEGDVSIGDVHDAVVGNRYPVGIAGQIMQDVFRSSEGPFRVNDPVFAEQRTEKRATSVRFPGHLRSRIQHLGPADPGTRD